ncbi:ATP-dependent DNA helicase PIF1, partial [Elysia marginata]
QERIADANVQKLSPEQSVIYNDFTQKIQNGQSGLCFLDAPGGCGKTFFIETILASQRAKGRIAIATASTGLAATLLPGGRTVHSTFKVPLNIINSETPSCSIKKGTALSRVLQDASVLIVDEATLLHRKVIEAIDTTLKDIRSSSEVMGGLLTLRCGDFRQILPVIRQAIYLSPKRLCLFAAVTRAPSPNGCVYL